MATRVSQARCLPADGTRGSLSLMCSRRDARQEM
jgi:hypothetical protein